MNWEWYYNCHLYKDEPVAVTCKICGNMNVFLPGEINKKCGHCGIECRRFEVDGEKARPATDVPSQLTIFATGCMHMNELAVHRRKRQL